MLRVIESLSLEGNGPAKSAVSDHINKGKIDPNKSYTRNPRPNSKNWHTSSTFTLKEKSVKKGADEDSRSNIRADSVPRPRAVLSSPDNDDMIGNQNKRIQERRRSAKGQASDTNEMISTRNPVTGKRTASSTQRSYVKTQANNNIHSIHRTERQKPFNLKSLIQPNIDNLQHPQMYRNIPPRASHSDGRLQSSSNYKRSVFNKVGASNGYPKIKCSDS